MTEFIQHVEYDKKKKKGFSDFCVGVFCFISFDMFLYIPVNNFSAMAGMVSLVKPVLSRENSTLLKV